MIAKKIEEVGNPIVYIFLTLALSCIFYGLYDKFMWLTIFIVSLFFISLIYYCGISFSVFMLIFFSVGILLNFSYYKIPDKRDGEVRILKLTSYAIIGEYEGKNISLKIREENLHVGDKYRVKGNLINIQDKSNGIVGELEVKEFYKVKGDWISKLYEFKRNVYNRLERNLGKRKAGLLSSIAFGYSDNLDFEDKEDMKDLGIIHSISVSGLHVAIVYIFLRIFLGDKLGLITTMIYVVFTGYNYSSIRAFVMLSCVEGGHILKRNNSSISALCLSALILILYQPFSIFNISFHLTYLATLGIILYNKKFTNLLYTLPAKFRDSLSLTFSAQIFTVPYLIFIFKDFSANFIVGNLLLVPFVDLMVITGNILPLTYVFPWVFDFCSYINLIIIKMFDFTLNIIEKFSMPMFYGNEYVVFFYLFLLLSFYFVKKGYKKFLYLPIISIFIITIQMYSPIPNIRYYKEGAILINYKGERVLITNKSGIDIKRLSEAAMAVKTYKKAKAVSINGVGNIKSEGKDYLLETSKEKYLLKVSTSKNQAKEYDIINFKDGFINRIFIINGEVISFCYGEEFKID